MEKSKTERSPWIKSTKKPGPKKKKRKGFAEERNKSLAESDKGSWFGQAPLSTSTDEHERSDSAGSLSSVGASRLKIKAFDNATYYGGSSSESDETDDGEFETSDTKSTKHNLPQRPHFGYESSPNVLGRFDRLSFGCLG